MMKRILSLTLAVALIIVLALPVSAANDSGWIELLEYDTVNSSGKNLFSYTTSGTFEITLPRRMRLSKIDMLVSYSYGTKPDYVEVAVGSKWVALEIHEIQNGLARIVGRFDYTFYNSVIVRFRKSAAASSTVEVFSCKVTPLTVQEFFVDASLYVGGISHPIGQTYNKAGIGDDYTTTPIEQTRITVKDWQKYDSLTIWGSFSNLSLSSIRATLYTSGLPISVSYMDMSNTGYWVEMAGSSLESLGSFTTLTGGKYLFCITIDLTDVDRTLTDPLYVYMTGLYKKAWGFSFTCQYVNGHVFTADTSDVTFWVRFKEFLNICFSGLTSAINTGFSNVNSWITAQTNTLSARLNNIWQEIEDGFTNVGSWFEQYLGVTDQEQETIDELDQSSESISQGASDIQDFEQSQQDVLDNNFDEIQDSVNFTSFANALVFVQKYTNMTVDGISGYVIVFTLPMFLGLFFFLCSRIPGRSQWKSRPPNSKGG